VPQARLSPVDCNCCSKPVVSALARDTRSLDNRAALTTPVGGWMPKRGERQRRRVARPAGCVSRGSVGQRLPAVWARHSLAARCAPRRCSSAASCPAAAGARIRQCGKPGLKFGLKWAKRVSFWPRSRAGELAAEPDASHGMARGAQSGARRLPSVASASRLLARGSGGAERRTGHAAGGVAPRDRAVPWASRCEDVHWATARAARVPLQGLQLDRYPASTDLTAMIVPVRPLTVF